MGGMCNLHFLFISMVWTIWGRVTWDDLVKFRGEWFLHWWERMSLFKLRKKKNSGRPKITLAEVVKRTCQLMK